MGILYDLLRENNWEWNQDGFWFYCGDASPKEALKEYEKLISGKTCNRMCLLSEWDEYKPRDCSTCSGRKVIPQPQKEQTEVPDRANTEQSTSPSKTDRPK